MDKEQEEMQFLGILSVYKESYKMIISWRKILSQITISLILPLSFIYLIHIEVSNIIFRKILHNTEQMMETPQGTTQSKKLSDMISSEWATFFLFKLLYFAFLLVFSLLSTSAVVYTVASVYTSRQVTFKRVMSVVPRVWKRLMVTFLCAAAAFFFYNLVTLLLLVVWVLTMGSRGSGGVVVFVIIGVIYFAGFVYLTVVWQLASVVSVLEQFYGFKAMMKGKELIKGKTWLSIVIFLKLNVSFVLIQLLFKRVVVRGWSLSSLDRTAYGVLCFLLLSHLFLFGLVVQTVLYFVCKSYHHQNIDKSALSDHLEVYLGDYEPLTSKDVQLEQYHV